jgi:ATP-dependent exoDNAse (exonuclease V) beta subunit
LVHGTADLVLQYNDGFVLIDHKTFPGSTDQALSEAAKHAGQLRAYARAIAAATGRKELGRFIHMPVVGVVVELGR